MPVYEVRTCWLSSPVLASSNLGLFKSFGSPPVRVQFESFSSLVFLSRQINLLNVWS